LRVETHGAGLTLPPTASETEIAAALSRLLSEPHFAVAARRLGEAIADDIKAGRIVLEMEEIVEAQPSMRRAAGIGS
jgi:UDP:flavonoid glycosyltransferase YjiC (YdhE family)